MKLNARQIDGFLSKPTQSKAVLIYGPDQGLVTRRARQVMQTILGDASNDFNQIELSEEGCLADPAKLSDELNAMSLMGGNRVIWLRDAGGKCSAIIQTAIEALPETSSVDVNYLLVTAGDCSPRSSLRKLFEATSTLAALPCYPDEKQSVSQLVQQLFSRYQLKAEREVIHYLSDALSGDRMLIESELERIALYYLDLPSVDLLSLRELVESDQDSSFDRLSHAFMQQNASKFLTTLDRLLVEGVQPVIIIRTIDRLAARILELCQLHEQGMAVEQAMSALRPPVFFKDKPLFSRYANHWRADELAQIRHQLMRLEGMIKSAHEVAEIRLKDGLLRLMLRRRSKAAA